MRALPARYCYPCNTLLLVLASTFVSKDPLCLCSCSCCIPPSEISIHNEYDVPEDKQPKRNRLTKVTSNVNSSVNGFNPARNIPTQNPKHIGQANSSPKKPFVGLIGFSILPYTPTRVSP